MDFYISIIKQSFAFFPLIAAVFTLPYVIYNYHKYGSVFSIRILIVYSFILYMMTVFFLTSLPLHSREYVANLQIARHNIQPFNFIKGILKEAPMVSDDPKTWIELLHSRTFKEYIANIIMCIPFGMYMRYYFKQNIFVSVILSFAFSLFLETTQLTGLWFIYPRNYRMFDVDDLVANTLGGLIGYILMIPLGLLLPSRHRIDAASYRRGRKVSLFRWLIAIGIDMALYAWMAVYAGSAWPLAHMRFLAYMTAIAVVVSSLMSWIFAGRTLGLAIMSLKVVSKDQRRAPLYKLFLRYSIQYLFILGYPLICQIFYYRINSHQTQFLLIAIGIYGFIWLVDLLVFLEKRQNLAGLFSKTHLISTVRVESN